MKKISILIAVLATVFAFAQKGPNNATLNYDLNLEETHVGTIQSSNIGTGLRNGQYTMTNDSGLTLNLAFGPPRFLSQLNVTLGLESSISVTGMPFTNANGTQLFIVKDFIFENQTYAVRDAEGTPLWSGRKNGQKASKKGGNGRGGNGNSGQQGSCMLQYLATTPMQDIDEIELAALTLMREEEKLARDVYLYLAQNSSLRVFTNIAKAEQKHMDAVGVILDRYEITDPITDDTPGHFASEVFTTLYNDLTTAGSASQTAALFVGATIEDLDIADLFECIETTDNTDIKMVYQNLLKGSRNHLRSFVGLLIKAGEPYAAQYITQEEVDAIVNSPRERRTVLDENGEPLEACSNSRGGGNGRGGNGRGGK